MKKRILGVIPARGGSKGIPKKNLFPLAGQPLIAYSIEAALASELISEVVVSTDDEQIKAVALAHGAEVPFMRPAELASDQALAIPTIQHAVRECEQRQGGKYDYVVMLQPTAPLRLAQDIDDSLTQLIAANADGLISIVDVGNYHPAKMKLVEADQLLDYLPDMRENPPRQSLSPVYIVNGAIYATKRDVLMQANSFKGAHCLPFVMPRERSANIDELEDMVVAEYFLHKRLAKETVS